MRYLTSQHVRRLDDAQVTNNSGIDAQPERGANSSFFSCFLRRDLSAHRPVTASDSDAHCLAKAPALHEKTPSPCPMKTRDECRDMSDIKDIYEY
jgi:hypothetical protein